MPFHPSTRFHTFSIPPPPPLLVLFFCLFLFLWGFRLFGSSTTNILHRNFLRFTPPPHWGNEYTSGLSRIRFIFRKNINQLLDFGLFLLLFHKFSTLIPPEVMNVLRVYRVSSSIRLFSHLIVGLAMAFATCVVPIGRGGGVNGVLLILLLLLLLLLLWR